jgi:hypothetical protein
MRNMRFVQIKHSMYMIKPLEEYITIMNCFQLLLLAEGHEIG